LDPETVATLSEVWVLVHDIPEEARKEPFLELISHASSKLVTMDSRSLPRLGLVRMLIPSPDPSKLACTLLHFFGKGGRTLVVEVGDGKQSRSTTPPPNPDQQRHNNDAEAECRPVKARPQPICNNDAGQSDNLWILFSSCVMGIAMHYEISVLLL
jgi:hypothetical protein